MDCRYAVESFNERFNKDASFSVDTVNKIMADLRQIIDDRNKSLTRIVEHFARASVLKKSQADLKVRTTWFELQKMELDKSSLIQHDLDLGMAITRISEAKNDGAALQVWKKDKETVWRKRIYISNVYNCFIKYSIDYYYQDWFISFSIVDCYKKKLNED